MLPLLHQPLIMTIREQYIYVTCGFYDNKEDNQNG